jgi:multidrug resistance efflux pump
MKHDHQPDPEFVSNLEWQVRTALRRERRFAEPVHSRSGGRMQIAALVLMSALLGAGGVVVKDEVQGARQKELLLAQVTADVRLAAAQRDLLRDRLAEAQRMHDDGTVSDETLREAQLQARQADLNLARLKLNEEEIRAGGKAPEEGVAAPLVHGRDFVSERLNLEAAMLSEHRDLARARLRRAEDLRDAGLVGADQAAQAEMQVRQMDAQLQQITTRIDLRRQVLAGALSGDEAQRQVELAEVQTELAALASMREAAHARLRLAEQRVAAGVVRESELGEARLALMQMESRMEILQLKQRILEEEAAGK